MTGMRGSTLVGRMRALRLHAYGEAPYSISCEEIETPRPSRGEVLVKMAASPIHFHDHLFLRGKYGLKKKLPAVPGTEGSGTVIATGGGLVARALQGRRVACAAKPDGDGPWADYMVTSANLCLPLRSQITFEEGATILGNPLTAWAFIEIAKRGGHRAIVQSAAAGTLGRMVLKLATRFGIPVINIIRSAEQAQLLKSAGASYILDSSADGFPERLKEL